MDLPEGGLLFCHSRFHDLNGVPDDARWRHEHRDGDRLVGVLDGVVTDGVLLSGHSAPFGGFDLARADPTVAEVVGLVEGTLAAARADGITTVRIRCRPREYAPAAEPLVEYALLNAGFVVEHCDLNQSVDLGPLAAGADPLTLLAKRTRRYVRAALDRPHRLSEVTDHADLETCHAIIAANRAAQGRPAPLDLDYLARARSAFPDRIRSWLLHREGGPVAAAVVYRVLPDVDQVVHWADADRDGDRSAMDLLAHLLTRHSAATGARLLDLGPSSEKDGAPNVGLAAFKRSVGASPGTRAVLVARLA
ncbi:GNAT family N-acetyltransferase [Blastococcus sp. SYSU D00820]